MSQTMIQKLIQYYSGHFFIRENGKNQLESKLGVWGKGVYPVYLVYVLNNINQINGRPLTSHISIYKGGRV